MTAARPVSVPGSGPVGLAAPGHDAVSRVTETGAVLHVLWSLELGGLQRAVYQLVREQRRRGVDADVLVASTAGLYGERAEAAGAEVFALGQRSALDVGPLRAASRILEAYPIVHFHAVEPLLIRAAARAPGVRLFYTHRAGAFRYPLRKRARLAYVAGTLRRRFETVSGNTAHAARVAAGLFGIPEEHVRITYNGLDFALLAPERPAGEVRAELGARPGDVLVGTSGNLRDWKRVDRLLRAIAALEDEPVHAVVIGDGPERSELERLAGTLGIADRVTFTGVRAHVGDYLQILKAFVLPSGPEESFGNSAVEAMAVGLPVVVCGDGGGLLEHVDDGRTGLVVDDEAELVRRLRDLVRDEALRRRLGTAARDAVRMQYTVEAMVQAYDDLYAPGAVGPHA